MMPHGTPAKSFSAFWQSSAFSTGSSFLPVTVSIKVAVETSKAALLESPPPSGTVECSNTSRPPGFRPRARQPAITPRGQVHQQRRNAGVRVAVLKNIFAVGRAVGGHDG